MVRDRVTVRPRGNHTCGDGNDAGDGQRRCAARGDPPTLPPHCPRMNPLQQLGGLDTDVPVT